MMGTAPLGGVGQLMMERNLWMLRGLCTLANQCRGSGIAFSLVAIIEVLISQESKMIRLWSIFLIFLSSPTLRVLIFLLYTSLLYSTKRTAKLSLCKHTNVFTATNVWHPNLSIRETHTIVPITHPTSAASVYTHKVVRNRSIALV